ncbi:MAG: hypothetical protein ACI9XR_000854 [Flavobacterium sp.]|jgi:hypothetical protein
MAKLYTKNSLAKLNMVPKKETINFLLNYSKALKIVTIGKLQFEIIVN